MDGVYYCISVDFMRGLIMYKAVIFDLDGTLLDTLQDLYLSVNYALKSCGRCERTIDEIKSFVGDGVGKLVERAAGSQATGEEVQTVLRIFKEHYSLHSRDNTAPYTGVNDLLERLVGAGIKIAVVSNKLDEATKLLCREYFGDNVSVAIGDSEGRNKKPAPDSVLEALRVLGMSVEEAVYVGDSEVDILTASNCGMKCISVTWGFRSREVLEAAGGRVFAEDTKALEAVVFHLD